MTSRAKLNLGIFFTLLTALCYAIQTAFVKHSSLNIPIPILIFIQSMISLVLIMPIIYKKYGTTFINPITFSIVKKQHLIRATASLGISYFLFFSLQNDPYFDSMLLYNVFPLLSPVFGFVILNQRINFQTVLFILFGFFGVLLILNPDKNLFSCASCLALFSAFCTALSVTMIKKISYEDDSLKSLYYYFLISLVISGLIIFIFRNYQINANYTHILYLALFVGILFFMVQYFLTLATQFSNPIIVSVLYYTNIIFSLLISAFIFHEIILPKTIIGMVFIIIGGLGVIFFQKKQFKQSCEVKYAIK